MLQLDHGFQFSWGGDQGTTPPVLRLSVGSNSSKDEWVSKETGWLVSKGCREEYQQYIINMISN